MAVPSDKQVIYVDVDDEITNIIDKVNSADSKIVALVLPKRASVFQSVVNMKLLKRRADGAKKHIVLITSEASLLPLAGLSGMHVAPTLQSKPVIPPAPDHDPSAIGATDTAELSDDDFDPATSAATPVGQLAANKPRVIAPAGTAAGDGAIELDNTEPAAKAAPTGRASKAAGKSHDAVQKPGNKGFKIPDFFRFRKRLLLIFLGLVLLVVAYIVMFRVLPSGAVTIRTKADDINSSLNLTLNTKASSLDAEKLVVPASLQQQQKSYTQQVAATGQKNNGARASGNVNASVPCSSNVPAEVPAGTGVSANGLTFITQSSITFAPSVSGGSCRFTGQSPITAQQAGAQYNLGNASFTIAGRSDVEASSDGTGGGSDQIVKVVQQSDIDGARAKLNSDSDKETMKQQLKRQLEESDLYAIQASFSATPANVTSSTPANQPADTVTVSQTVTYAMYGAKGTDLRSLVKASAEKQIDTGKQSILEDGVDGAKFAIDGPGTAPELRAVMSVTSTAGPKIDVDNLAPSLAGKKTGDVKSTVGTVPGVTDVQVKYAPFWVTRMPSNPEKITIQFQKDSTADDGNRD